MSTRVGQERDLACAFDSLRQQALMPGTRTRLATRKDAPSLVHVLPQQTCILVINGLCLIGAELADLRARNKSAWAGKSFVFVYIFF